jgi:hypothetical protein
VLLVTPERDESVSLRNRNDEQRRVELAGSLIDAITVCTPREASVLKIVKCASEDPAPRST